MSLPGIITLTTDFGLADTYVGTMKGVILSINPQCTIVDITHQVPSQDIMGGCFALSAAYSFFPEGTIHTAVVDWMFLLLLDTPIWLSIYSLLLGLISQDHGSQIF